MLKSERINFLAKKVAPNPLEATYWIDLTEDPQGTVWKWYDPEDNIWKVLLLGNQEGTLDAYTKAESDRIFATNQSVEDLVDIINSKQDQLVSEVNIKTINGTSILGSGDISIDRGLNQNQVQDLIDESTKDFITVDETHEYVQEEIAKLKLVVLDKTKLPESIYNLIFNEEVDYSAIEEDLLTTENQLLYIDPDNGMYRLSYNQVTNQIDYVYTTIVQGKVIEQSNSLDDEGLHQNYTISKDIVLYTDNQHDGITIQCEKNGINREVTLFSRGDGESYLSDDGQYKVIGAINLYTSMDRLPDKLGVLLDNTAITLDNFNDAKTYLTELGEPVYLLLTDKYNPTEKEYSTIEGNQLHTFYYDNEEDCIYIVEYINPLHQIYSNDNPLGNVVEVTKISNTAQVISRRINRGIYSDSQGFNIQVEDNTTDSSTDPNGTTVRRHLNVITEGNGKDVLFNDGEYRNLQDSIDFSNYLAKDNTEPYTPTGPYNPATKKYVDTEIADLINSAPATLDTLKELADAIGNDPNFATTVVTLIGTKEDHINVGEVADLLTDNKTIVPAINELELQVVQAQKDVDDLQEYLEGDEFKQYIENLVEESIGEDQGWQPPTSGDGTKFLDDSGVFDTIKIRDVQGLTTTGSGNIWLADNGVYTNPFPDVSEEQVLTILPNQIVSSKPVQIMNVVTEETQEYTAETLNAEYHNKPVGFTVNQYILGKVFQKVSNTGVWISYNVSTVV